MKGASVLLVLAILAFPLFAQTTNPDTLSRIKKHVAEERWQDVVQIAEAEPDPSADILYFYGIALARLERWEDAESAFERGRKANPRDKRFPIELAGVSFRQKDYEQAAAYLKSALRIDPEDAYASDFLGSVYFLQGNLEAALKYWNRVSRPRIEQVLLNPPLKVDQVLLDRAFDFAPASVLQLSELKTTQARVDGLDIFPDRKFDLEARPGGKFDLVFRARERNGLGSNKWQALISFFRGLPFQTVHPEYYNIGGRAINAVSLFRWDAQKRRLWANLSGPFSGDPKRRYHLELDLRDENWDVRDFSADAGRPEGLKLYRNALSAGVTTFESGRWTWSARAELSHRRFRDLSTKTEIPNEFLRDGFQLKFLVQNDFELVRDPERRFSVTSGLSLEIGRIWSTQPGTFGKLQGSLETRWFPQASGDDYEMCWKVRLGRTVGEIPFDELFLLGVERDNDLWLRAHSGTRNGRKGNAPMGRNYFLSNWEIDKNVFSRSLINIKLGPFLDVGRITDPSARFGSEKWLWDLGARVKVGALGQRVGISYGRDLRTGNAVFFVSVRKSFE